MVYDIYTEAMVRRVQSLFIRQLHPIFGVSGSAFDWLIEQHCLPAMGIFLGKNTEKNANNINSEAAGKSNSSENTLTISSGTVKADQTAYRLPEDQHIYSPAEFQRVQMKHESVHRESMLYYKKRDHYLRDQLEKERNENLYRQSQEFEAQVTDGNPAIIVMNDKNSPNEIGMEFDNLYNSQFVDALGEFKEQGFNKRKTIPEFLHILKTAFQFCRDTATNQLERMKQFVIDPFSVEVSEIQPQNIDTSKLPKHIIKQLKDARKNMALYTTETVCEKFNKKLDSSGVFVKLKSHEKTDMFIRKCVQLCWLMSIQDPPLSLCFHCPEKKFLDKEVFRTYTRPGNIFEYMVWPALMLSENGPVIKRGIVQVKK